MKSISATELRQLLSEPTTPPVLDVRLADDHAAARIPGARNNCVFEIAFGSRLSDTAPDRSATVVVCGADAGGHEASMAAEKLERAGYRDVRVLTGGLAAWREAGEAIEGDGAPPSAPGISDGRHAIDLEESRVGWKGRNLLNQHHGTVALKSGEIEIRDGLPVAGTFVIDLRSIRCTDLAGGELHDVLVRHLEDHDFFDVRIHPEATLKLVEVSPVPDATPGAPNAHCRAELTLKGVTAPLEFDAACGVTPDGRFAAQSVFAFDRTLWNVIYGSGKFFTRLGGHLVNDLIEIEVRLVTTA